MHSSERIGKLYIVATPIGNLEDITLRAINTLKEVDIIACEDTRRALKLLNHFSIKNKKLVSYHEHNEREVAEKLVKDLLKGKDIALVSDAGTPCISDPGFRVVKLARENGIEVVPIPGPSSITAALSASGFPTDRFLFIGFLPRKEGKLKETLEEVVKLPYTVIAFESPHRLERTLEFLSQISKEKKIGVYREITKINEEFLEGTPREVLGKLKEEGKLKGEFVILFYPEKKEKNENAENFESILEKFLKEGKSLKEAVKETCKLTGLPKNLVYRKGLELFGNRRS
ncbi:MAG: 16S rRNA (cytidine(1402)-2'-O)-methyltransferase [Desulfurobacteriaceae bacterium]